MTRVLSVVGARPQFVKAAVVSKAISQTRGLMEILVHTGQHYDENMSNVFFDELGIPNPKYQLDLGGGSHGEQTGRMIPALEKIMAGERPDWILVYGDTNSTLASALAAAKLNIPIAHVEAGLRCFNRAVPEEINRVVTDRLATLLFSPTKASVENLRAEGIDADAIHLVGDVMYDAALTFAPVAEQHFSVSGAADVSETFALATVHRQENTDDPQRLRAIFEALTQISRDLPIVLPLHPRTRARLPAEIIAELEGPRFRLPDPVSYLHMLTLLKRARLVITDSGGLQKEAYFFRVPCLTLRGETEWVELVEQGWNRLCKPINSEDVVAAARELLAMSTLDSSPNLSLYGAGKASQRIAEILLSWPRQNL